MCVSQSRTRSCPPINNGPIECFIHRTFFNVNQALCHFLGTRPHARSLKRTAPVSQTLSIFFKYGLSMQAGQVKLTSEYIVYQECARHHLHINFNKCHIDMPCNCFSPVLMSQRSSFYDENQVSTYANFLDGFNQSLTCIFVQTLL